MRSRGQPKNRNIILSMSKQNNSHWSEGKNIVRVFSKSSECSWQPFHPVLAIVYFDVGGKEGIGFRVCENQRDACILCCWLPIATVVAGNESATPETEDS